MPCNYLRSHLLIAPIHTHHILFSFSYFSTAALQAISSEEEGKLLQVDVAQRRTGHGVKHVLNGQVLAKNTDIERIVDARLTAGRRVAEGDGTVDGVHLVEVESLPDPVDAVDHGVVLVEGRVVEGGEDVGAVATHGVVTSAAEK